MIAKEETYKYRNMVCVRIVSEEKHADKHNKN